jgi:hypothetical protein
MADPLVEATTTLFDLLKPFPSEERRKIIQAVLVLLGDDSSAVKPTAPSTESSGK